MCFRVNNNVLIHFVYLQICQASFNSLKELTTHMAETNHFDQYPQAVIENKNATDGTFDGKRKKSLPVRKLLEIERSNAATLMNRKPTEKIPGTKMKFNCDKCGVKYEANQIMGHIRKCGSPGPGNGLMESPVDNSKEVEDNSIVKSEDTDEVSIISNKPAAHSTVMSPSSGSFSLASTSSILGSLERMVESSFKAFKENNAINTEVNLISEVRSKEEEAQGILPNEPTNTMLQRLGLDDNSNNVHPSRLTQRYTNNLMDGSHDQQIIGRAQSPFPLPQSPNRMHDSSPILHSTSSISSTFTNNVLLQGYHQPLTALRKLVEINRNVSDIPNITRSEDAAPDIILYPNSPASNTPNDHDNDASASEDCSFSLSKRQKVSTTKDASLTSTPDSTSSNPTVPANIVGMELHSKVSFWS